MAFDSFKKAISQKLVGVDADRIGVRTQGCWNCIHGDHEAARKLWWDKARGDILARAITIATSSKLGEEDPRVLAIRRDVPAIDQGMQVNGFVSCKMGRDPKGGPLGDFIASTYLCDRWTGRDGASLAREGQAPDKLPEELMERHGSGEKID